MSGIDWRSELRKIEREFDGLPPEKKAEKPAKPRLKLEPTVTRMPSAARAALGSSPPVAVWARLALVTALAGAITVWPYAHACGFGLITYLSASTMIIVGGVWASTHTWRSRMALAHTLAFGLVVFGLASVGAQVAPRVGYTVPAAVWWCGK